MKGVCTKSCPKPLQHIHTKTIGMYKYHGKAMMLLYLEDTVYEWVTWRFRVNGCLGWALLAPPYNLLSYLDFTCGLLIGSYIYRRHTYTMSSQNPKELRRQVNRTKNTEHVSDRINDKDGTSGSEDTLAAEITSILQLLKQMDANLIWKKTGNFRWLRALGILGSCSLPTCQTS